MPSQRGHQEYDTTTKVWDVRQRKAVLGAVVDVREAHAKESSDVVVCFCSLPGEYFSSDMG
jgi:hypothetical protein